MIRFFNGSCERFQDPHIEGPNAAEVAGLESLRRHLEEKMMGSFSIAPEAIWKVENL